MKSLRWLLLALAPMALDAQVQLNPVITTLNARQPSTPLPGGTTITAGTSSAYLVIGGTGFTTTLDIGAAFVRWTPAIGSPTNISASTITATQIVVIVPTALMATPGTVGIQVVFPVAAAPVASNSVPLTIAPPMAAAGLPVAIAGRPYSQPLLTGGTPPYAFTLLNASTLPPGLTANTDGTLAGTAPPAGTYGFTLGSTDAWSPLDAPLSNTYSLQVVSPAAIATSTLPSGTVGVPYTATVVGAGGTGAYSWSLAAPVPAGFTIGATTGLISGTPAAPGNLVFNVVLTDAVGGTASTALTAAIQSPVAITTTALSNGTAAVPYTAQLAATGGAPPYTWSASGLPAWLALNPATGALTGTPPAAGTFAIGVSVFDTLQRTATTQFGLTIAGPFSILTTSPLPNGTALAPYSRTLAATGGNAPYTWAVTAGTLPGGLTLNPATGAITGSPAAAGNFSFTIGVTEPGGGSASRVFALTVDSPLSITTTVLPPAAQDVAYTAVLAATGGSGSYTWSATGLPAWLALDPATGALSGTPPATGSFSISFTVFDRLERSDTRAFTLAVAPSLSITSTSPLANAIAGVAYTFNFTATGGLTPYTWTAASLPTGLTVSSGGLLSGIPRTPGTSTFPVTVTGGSTSVTRNFTLTVGPTNLTVATTSLPGAVVANAYTAHLSATGATPPYTWAAIGGSLPQGLQLQPSGIITGLPGTTGNFAFTVQVTDSTGQVATRTLSIEVTTPISPLTIQTASLPDGTVGQGYGVSLQASGGEPPHGWSIGGLPPGLFGNAEGQISGTPTQAGTYNVNVQLNDRVGRTVSRTLSLLVKPAALLITTATLTDGTVGSPYSARFVATGGTTPYTWSAGSSLPPGLSFAAGVLSGTPEAEGSFNFTVQVTDTANTTAQKGFTLTIRPAPLVITTASPLAGGTLNQSYSAALGAMGGAPPYRWSVSGLPPGLGSDVATGSISGIPTAAGTYAVAAQVTDSKGATAQKAFDLTVLAPGLTITTMSPLPDGTVGVPYSGQLSAAGGTPPYRWSMTAGWGGGITVGGNGTLGGTPTDAGDYTMYVQVTDAESKTATKALSLTVVPPVLTITTTSLAGATVGTAYSAGFAATGNIGPVRWAADGLPGGLQMQTDGVLSGIPTAPGSFNLAVRATDMEGRTATRAFTLAVALPVPPGVNFTGVQDIVNPAQQPTLGIGLTGTYPVPIGGRITLTFAPQTGGDDPAVQFSTGGRTVDFTIPAGANLATFTVPSLGLQTGTVAGTITLTVSLQAAGSDVTPAPAPSRVLRVNPMPPVITSATLTRTATGFEIQITGYSTSREITQAVFRFTPAPGATLQTTEVTVPVGPLFTGWFSGTSATAFGSRFTFTQPFTVQGTNADIGSITIVLVNALGNSQPATVTP